MGTDSVLTIPAEIGGYEIKSNSSEPIIIIASSSWLNVHPPASGVPVPQNTEGSSTSRSIVRYTGFPFNSFTASFNPSKEMLTSIKSFLYNFIVG